LYNNYKIRFVILKKKCPTFNDISHLYIFERIAQDVSIFGNVSISNKKKSPISSLLPFSFYHGFFALGTLKKKKNKNKRVISKFKK